MTCYQTNHLNMAKRAQKHKKYGLGKFLQNHETRHKQKWASANDIEDLETTHSLSIKTV